MEYRIVCTNHEAVNGSTTHTHIVDVGTGGDPNKADRRWTVDEVLTAMRLGDVFYTRGETSGKVALVEPFDCSLCRRTYIRSKPDAVHDNNLNSLRVCRWN